ncbi:hypothetical protein CALCODRAFT_447664 [Calocera cornea HHB12733]|uniref:HIT domain-containing protein n=1 Tax=Calocera cornea HHB12733 TaxID=1353952 RepID=A0A165J4I8_9BASI|nr:hypothetical protein CALCODRAFT_447664 [Calocera cornea HHB12733]
MAPTPPYPFAPRLGCPLCTIVACARHSDSSPGPSPSHPASNEPSRSSSAGAGELLWTTPGGGEVVYHDDEVTAYIERKEPVSSRGHLVIVFNAHIPSLYSLTPSIIPLLQRLLSLAPALLEEHFPRSHPSSPEPEVQVGFITPPLWDPKLPVRDHLHAHAYLGSADRVGWLGMRALAHSAVGWYSVDDLIAEIREATSNNRIRSGGGKRVIGEVPGAGVRRGLPDGRELVDHPSGGLLQKDGESRSSGQEG